MDEILKTIKKARELITKKRAKNPVKPVEQTSGEIAVLNRIPLNFFDSALDQSSGSMGGPFDGE